MSRTSSRSVKVGKRENYQIDLTDYVENDEIITVHNVVNTDGKVTIETIALSDNKINISITGVSVGCAVLEVSFATDQLRSDCIDVRVKVEEC